MKNAISRDLEFSLRELPETRVRKMDKRDTGIKNKGDEKGRGAAHKSEWWRRTIATKDSILAGHEQRNNAESIEVGLATTFVVVVLSVRRGSNASARLNSLYFLERRIFKSFEPPLYPGTTGRVHSAGTVFFFSLLLPQCLSLVLFPQTRTSRRAQCDSAEGCEELLTFHCEHWICGSSSRRSSLWWLLLSLFLFSIPFVPPINDDSVQSA